MGDNNLNNEPQTTSRAAIAVTVSPHNIHTTNILAPDLSSAVSTNNSFTSTSINATVPITNVPIITTPSNLIAYPSLACHPNPHTLTYQAFVPHPSFVGTHNLNPYQNLGGGQTCIGTTQPRITTLPAHGLSLLPHHATLMQLTPAHSDFNQEQLAVSQTAVVTHAQQQTIVSVAPLALQQQASNSATENSSLKSNGSVVKSLNKEQSTNDNRNVSTPPTECTSCEDCFICGLRTKVSGSSSKCCTKLSTVMPHSHAPLLVLLADVLGYDLTSESNYHSKVVCQSCISLLEVIDEVQLIHTRNKAEVRQKFQKTINKKKLPYSRSEKTGKSLCSRCGFHSVNNRKMKSGLTPVVHMSPVKVRKKRPLKEDTFKNKAIRSSDERKRKTESYESSHHEEAHGDHRNLEDETQSSDSKAELHAMLNEMNLSVNNINSEKETSVITSDTNKLSDINANLGSDSHSETLELDEESPTIKVFDDDPTIFGPHEKLKVGSKINSEYQCSYCPHSCDSETSLKFHARIIHLPMVVYESPIYKEYKEDSISNSKENIQTHNEVILKLFRTKKRIGLKIVLNNGSNGLDLKPFICLFCENAFKHSSSLLSHFKELHTDCSSYKCPNCSSFFKKTSEMAKHNCKELTPDSDDSS